MKGSLYSVTLRGDTCLANLWKSYPEPAFCTVMVLAKQAGEAITGSWSIGWSDRPQPA